MEHIDYFTEQFQFLFHIAYRMLGSLNDAEDVMQDCFIEFSKIPLEKMKSPKKLLTTILSRTAIDRYKKAKREREIYKGVWLPEPIVAEAITNPELLFEKKESISIALLFLLERLNPKERAAFVLRDLFDLEYQEIAEIFHWTNENTRKLASRARSAIASENSKYSVSKSELETILLHFMKAIQKGNKDSLIQLLESDICLYSDGGGKVRAALKPIFGTKKVSQFLIGLSRKPKAKKMKPIFILVNSKPALAFFLNKEIHSILFLEPNEKKLKKIFIWLNPDKINSLKITNPSKFDLAHIAWKLFRLKK